MEGRIRDNPTNVKTKINSKGLNYRITLQYKFKRTTLRNTSTDKLSQSMLFSFAAYNIELPPKTNLLFIFNKYPANT